jgi:hypothetical protein
MFEWFGAPFVHFILPPPHMEIERQRSYYGRHNIKTGPCGLYIAMRFFNKGGRVTTVKSIQLIYAGAEGDPRRDGPSSLLTEQGWQVGLDRIHNILVMRDIPPRTEVERFLYFFLPRAPDTDTKLIVKTTFFGGRSREVTFTRAELG